MHRVDRVLLWFWLGVVGVAAASILLASSWEAVSSGWKNNGWAGMVESSQGRRVIALAVAGLLCLLVAGVRSASRLSGSSGSFR